MSSELDVPSLPFAKPAQIEKFEKMGFDQREAMDPTEVQERIGESAVSLAASYRKNGGQQYDSCVAIVDSALTEMGGAVGGKVGAIMVGISHREACRACREAFPEP